MAAVWLKGICRGVVRGQLRLGCGRRSKKLNQTRLFFTLPRDTELACGDQQTCPGQPLVVRMLRLPHIPFGGGGGLSATL